MKTIPKRFYKKEWYVDIEFNFEPIDVVLEKVGEKMFQPHSLDFHHLIVFLEGEGFHEVDFQDVPVKPNTILPIMSGQVHAFKKNQNLKGYFILFTSDFLIHDKVNLKYLFDFTLLNTFIKPLQVQASAETMQLVEMLKNAFVKRNVYDYEELMRTYLKLIILKLEHLKRQLVDTSISSSIQLSLRFNEELEKRISYKTKISEICKELNADSKKLSVAIKNATHKTPKQLLDERIILELKRQLVYTDLTIKEIAYNMGFEEASNFTNYFKKRTHLSPSEFRTKLKLA